MTKIKRSINFKKIGVCNSIADFALFLNLEHAKHSLVVTARSSGILKAKQKLGRTFNSDKLGGIAFTKISKLTMCSA